MSKNNLPLVSVSVISYNQKQFLKECIDSILIQNYNNLEIVIADDGSSDGSHQMLENYKNDFPGLFILKLSKKNKGITKKNKHQLIKTPVNKKKILLT